MAEELNDTQRLLAETMGAALDDVRAIFKPGAPYKFSIIARHLTDPDCHAMLGNDDLEGLAQFVGEMANLPDMQTHTVSSEFAWPAGHDGQKQ